MTAAAYLLALEYSCACRLAVGAIGAAMVRGSEAGGPERWYVTLGARATGGEAVVRPASSPMP